MKSLGLSLTGFSVALLALFQLSLSATRCGAEEQTKSTPGNGKVKEDLPNFHEVHPYLYRGGEPSQKGMEELKKLGVDTDIDLRAASATTEAEENQAHGLGMKYINLPMDSRAPTKQQVDTFLSAVKTARDGHDSAAHKVFVHCAHGSDRTGCMVGIWRVTEDGWNYDKTYEEMRKYYFGPKFVKLSGAVKQYAETASADASKSPVSGNGQAAPTGN